MSIDWEAEEAIEDSRDPEYFEMLEKDYVELITTWVISDEFKQILRDHPSDPDDGS